MFFSKIFVPQFFLAQHERTKTKLPWKWSLVSLQDDRFPLNQDDFPPNHDCEREGMWRMWFSKVVKISTPKLVGFEFGRCAPNCSIDFPGEKPTFENSEKCWVHIFHPYFPQARYPTGWKRMSDGFTLPKTSISPYKEEPVQKERIIFQSHHGWAKMIQLLSPASQVRKL